MALEECIIKIIMWYHYTPTRMVKIQIIETPNAGEDVEQQELSFIAGGNLNGTATLEDGLMGLFFFFFNKTKHTKNKTKI